MNPYYPANDQNPGDVDEKRPSVDEMLASVSKASPHGQVIDTLFNLVRKA